jgi:hypothetical protein
LAAAVRGFARFRWLSFGRTGVAVINIVLVGVWLLLAVGIAIHHRRLSHEDGKPRAG